MLPKKWHRGILFFIISKKALDKVQKIGQTALLAFLEAHPMEGWAGSFEMNLSRTLIALFI